MSRVGAQDWQYALIYTVLYAPANFSFTCGDIADDCLLRPESDDLRSAGKLEGGGGPWRCSHAPVTLQQ